MAQSFSKYPGVWLERNLPDHLYRNDELYGESLYNIVDIMVYEITELCNVDILEYCVDHYDFSDSLKKRIHHVIDIISNDKFTGSLDEIQLIEGICVNIINGIQELTNVYVQFGLWLCSKEAVYDLYDGTPENIKAYKTSDIILSDLGSDGILFGYTLKPEPLDLD